MKIAKITLFFVGLSIFQAFGMESGIDRSDALSIASQNSEVGESLPLPQWQRPSDETLRMIAAMKSMFEESVNASPSVHSHHHESSLSSVSAAGDTPTQIMHVNHANIVCINESITNKNLEELEFHLETSDGKSIYDMWNSACNVQTIMLPFLNALRLALISRSDEDKHLYLAMTKMLFDYENRHKDKLRAIGEFYVPYIIEHSLEHNLVVLVALADMGIGKAIDVIQEIHCGN